jgi:7-carboxy-7-deazaguanine synthase
MAAERLRVAAAIDDDYRYARTVSTRYPTLPVYLQVGNPAPLKHAGSPLPNEAEIDDLLARFRWLVGKVTADRWFTATLLPQLHVLAWGNERGV